MPSPGKVSVARIPTVPLGGRGAVIVALMGGSVTAAGKSGLAKVLAQRC